MGPHHSRKVLPPSPLNSTRLEPGQFTARSFPITATGVEVIAIGEERSGERIWIGGTAYGIEVTRHLRFFSLDAPALRPALFTALRALDGTRSIAELAESLGIALEDFLRLLGHLENEKLIHFHFERFRSPSHTRSEEMTRREIEREHLPHGSSFLHRSQQSIAIVSHPSSSISPIAASLGALLFGSGFERIKFITGTSTFKRVGGEQKISDRDLGLSIFNGTDIGALKLERLNELAHRSAILPLEEDRGMAAEDFDATLTISIGYPRPDHHQRWISEDRPFLMVPGYSQREIKIGPIVVPGKSPCPRCHELNQIENDFWREQMRQLQHLEPQIDPPQIASHLIASLAAQYATLWLDSGSDERMNHLLVGQELILDLDHSTAVDHHLQPPMRIVRWQNHPECGCIWIPERFSKVNAPA